MKKCLSLLVVVCLMLTACENTGESDTSNKVVSVSSLGSFLQDYEEALNNTLNNKSFTEYYDFEYQFISEPPELVSRTEKIEIMAVKDKSVSSTSNIHIENSNKVSDFIVAQVNQNGITYKRTQDGIEENLVQYEESLNDIYENSIPDSILSKIDTGNYDSIEWAFPDSLDSPKTGVYTLDYNPEYFISLLRQNLPEDFRFFSEAEDILVNTAKLEVKMIDNKIDNICLSSAGNLHYNNNIYNFTIKLKRGFSNLNNTFPDTIPHSKQALYTKI